MLSDDSCGTDLRVDPGRVARPVLGVPLYVRGETMLPIGLALSSAGIGLGAVFALMIGGAGASIPEVSMLTAMFKPRLAVTFVVTIIVTAIAAGYLIPLIA
ncbi:permease [uncultured Corynebacterium sp.]|uniref:permease n=1 Tax=uncultured Corynebacterium sp. TaxID=159447 RepID=UPI0025F695AF|nr:permease [uncultured Corynebacterium sp.]